MALLSEIFKVAQFEYIYAKILGSDYTSALEFSYIAALFYIINVENNPNNIRKINKIIGLKYSIYQNVLFPTFTGCSW